MALIEKQSQLDRNVQDKKPNTGPPVGTTLPQDGGYFTDQGNSSSPFNSPMAGGRDQLVDLLNSTVTSLNTGISYIPAPNDAVPTEQDLNGADPSTKPGTPNFFNGYGKGGEFQGKKLGGLDLHEALLKNSYTYNHGKSQTTILQRKTDEEAEGGSTGGIFDLNGRDGGQGYFHGKSNPGRGDGLKLKGTDLHEALLTQTYTYSTPGTQTVSVGSSPGATGFSDFQDFKVSDIGDFAQPNSTLGQFGGPYKHPENGNTF